MTSSMPRPSASTSSRSRSRSAGGSASTSSRRAVNGVRSRWARSAAASRSAVSSSPMRPASRLTAAPTSRTSRGPAGVARADRSPVESRCAVAARSLTGRVRERASRSATRSASTSRVRPSPASTSQVRVTPARSCAVGTNTSTTAVPSLRRTGCTRRVPSRPSTTEADAGGAPSARAPVAPSHCPSVQRTATLPPALLAAATFAATSACWSSPTEGMSACSCTCAVSSARAAATRATRDAAGRRKASSTTEVVAATSRVICRLTARARPVARPLPRTVCSSRGSAALSPSLRRSQERWTSTVLSAPP